MPASIQYEESLNELRTPNEGGNNKHQHHHMCVRVGAGLPFYRKVLRG